MSLDVLMPCEGTLQKWYRSVGDQIAAGDVLCEVETDKTVIEVEADSAGFLSSINVTEGTAGLTKGQILARLMSDRKGSEPGSKPDRNPGTGRDRPDAIMGMPAPRQFASMRARRLARKNSLLMTGIPGSGPGGRLIERDVAQELLRQRERSSGEGCTPALSHCDLSLPIYAAATELLRDRSVLSCEVKADKLFDLLRRMEGDVGTAAKLSPTPLALIVKAFALALAAGESADGETEVLSLDGGARWSAFKSASSMTTTAIAAAINEGSCAAGWEPRAINAVVSFIGTQVERCAPALRPHHRRVLAVGAPGRKVVSVDDGVVVCTMMTLALAHHCSTVSEEMSTIILSEIKYLIENPLLLLA